MTEVVAAAGRSVSGDMDVPIEERITDGLGDVDGAVPHDQCEAPIAVAGGDGIDHVTGAVAFDRFCEPRRVQLFEHPQRPPARLAGGCRIPSNPKPPWKERGRATELLEVVRHRPIGQGVDAADRVWTIPRAR